MKKVNWWIVGFAGVLTVLFFFGGGIMWGNRGYGMMGVYGMMGNWGHSPFGWFGMGLGMIFMWLLPIGTLALLVFGVVSLVRNAGNPSQASLQASCPNCRKGVQSDWRNCPHCGTKLK